MNNSFGQIVIGFFQNYLADARNLSPNSIASYRDCMKLLFSFVAEKLNITVEKINMEDITDDLIIEFLNYLENIRKNTTQTRNQRLAIIKTFFSFIAEKCPELIHVAEKISSISVKKTETKTINPLTEDELSLFFKGIKISELNGIRDLVLFRLMYNTGGRVSEIINLKIEDINLDTRYVKLHGKGDKDRTLILYQETIDAINEYLNFRKQNGIESDYLILNKYNVQMKRHGVNYLINKYVTIASQTNPSMLTKNITPHTFRHTMAFHMIKAGINIITIKDRMGHSDINTTSQYIQIDNQMKKEAIEKINPFKNSKASAKWKDENILSFLSKMCTKQKALC